MDTRKMNLFVMLVIGLTLVLGWILVGGPTDDSGKHAANAPQTPASQAEATPSATQDKTALDTAAQAGQAKQAEPTEQVAAPENTQPPSPEERAHAVNMLDFCNKATASLNNGWLGQGDVLAFFARVYLGEWQLPMLKPRKGKEAVSKRLVPPDGLFEAAEKTQLATNVDTMLKYVDTMLADYRSLAEYVMDPEIVDNGKKGKSLAASIQKSHASFAVARDAYLKLLRDRAAEAENVFLYEHPLKRQIVGARHVFALFAQMAGVLGLDKVDRDRLLALQAELEKEIATAGAPPFPAKPHMERPFRDFVRGAERFAELSQRGLDSGYDNELKRALNEAMVECRETYNAFVRVANGE